MTLPFTTTGYYTGVSPAENDRYTADNSLLLSLHEMVIGQNGQVIHESKERFLCSRKLT